MSQWLLRIAALYLIAGIILGIVMAASQDHSQMPLHAHLNLLGWVTLGMVGIWYRVQPEAAQTRLAKAHFWLHNLALPVLAVGLFVLLRGHPQVEPILAIASITIGIGVLCLVINIWRFTARTARDEKTSTGLPLRPSASSAPLR
jgi:hypothetical protein